MRILESAHIPYETASYDDDGEHELGRGAAEALAKKIGVDPKLVFKTIVMRTETKELCVFCESAVNEINLKKARTAAGAKEIDPVKPDELLQLTGYVRGGCSPLGAKKAYPVYLDESALVHERICISAGQRGEQIELAPGDLVRAADAVTVKIER